MLYIKILPLLIGALTSNVYYQAKDVVSVPVVYAETQTQEQWIDKLSDCESGGYDHAINPKDTDGTMSLGQFQFKVGTFLWLLDKYNIPPAPIFSSTTQRAIVKRMINDPDINIRQQFPDCVKNHIGLPPKEG